MSLAMQRVPRGRQELLAWMGQLGLRREEYSGLKVKARQVVMLHLEGLAAKDIALELSCSTPYVYSTLKSPHARALIDDYFKHTDQEFKALRPLAIMALRDALKPGQDIETRLRAADKVFKAQGDYDGRNALSGESAEDIVKRVLRIEIEETRSSRKSVSSFNQFEGLEDLKNEEAMDGEFATLGD